MPTYELQKVISAALRLGAFPILNTPPAKKQRRTVVPEDRFDIFEHFFDEPEFEPALPSASNQVDRDNSYATMWFRGEAAPPSSSTTPSPHAAPPPCCVLCMPMKTLMRQALEMKNRQFVLRVVVVTSLPFMKCSPQGCKSKGRRPS